MYYILNYIYKIRFVLSGKPRFYATFTLPTDKNSLMSFEADSVQDLANQIRSYLDSLKMSYLYFEADFKAERKYSNKGGSIKYSSPFTESEEREFLEALLREK